MAVNGLSDVFQTVTVPKPEYEKLVRDSEKLGAIERLLRKNKYVAAGDLESILDIEESEENNSESL